METLHFVCACGGAFTLSACKQTWWTLDRCARRTFECALSAEVSAGSSPQNFRAEKYCKGTQNAQLVVRSFAFLALSCIGDSRGEEGRRAKGFGLRMIAPSYLHGFECVAACSPRGERPDMFRPSFVAVHMR